MSTTIMTREDAAATEAFILDLMAEAEKMMPAALTLPRPSAEFDALKDDFHMVGESYMAACAALRALELPW